MSRISPLPQSRSKTSLLSNTTYHSFHDTQIQQSTNHPIPVEQQSKSVHGFDEFRPSFTEMHRQDSGYESITPRDPQPSPGATRRRAGSTTSSRTGIKTRPPTRRATKSSSVTRLPKSSKLSSRSPLASQSNPVTVTPSFYDYHDSSPYDTQVNAQTSYFHFPPPDPHAAGDILPQSTDELGFDDNFAENAAPYQVPPQTTHYWTSDRTRRLEYAAIDAASRGFKGWMMRHMVPGCFVPKEKRRVTFDDDTGSVRRYRIELESEESAEKDAMSADIIGRGLKTAGLSTWRS